MQTGKTIQLGFSRCVGKPQCKTKDEIDQFLKEHRIFLIMNQQAYNSNSYGEDGFIGLSTLAHYIDFEIDQPTQRLFYLQEH